MNDLTTFSFLLIKVSYLNLMMCAKRNILISFLIIFAKGIFEIIRISFSFLIMLAERIFEIIKISFLILITKV